MRGLGIKAGIGIFFVVLCCRCAAQSSPSGNGFELLPSETESLCPKMFSPISVSDHLRCFDDSIWSWTTAAAPAVSAGLAQWTGLSEGFTNNFTGLAKHFGVNLIGNVSGKFFGNFLMPSVFHEDPGFQRLGSSEVPNHASRGANEPGAFHAWSQRKTRS